MYIHVIRDTITSDTSVFQKFGTNSYSLSQLPIALLILPICLINIEL